MNLKKDSSLKEKKGIEWIRIWPPVEMSQGLPFEKQILTDPKKKESLKNRFADPESWTEINKI